MKGLAAVVLIGLSAGCATDYAHKSPDAVAQAVKVKNSDFDAQVSYIAPTIASEKRRGLFTDFQRSTLRSFVDKKTGKREHQLHLELSYLGGWRRYRTASFEGGEQRKLLIIDRRVQYCDPGICSYAEELGLSLTEAELRAAASGLRVRLNAKSGAENMIELPGDYVAGFLAALDR